MAVLVDTPRWPAHGTRWAHLVSDVSLSELHELAGRAGVPRRSFDLDHYDVPAARHADVVAAGAEPVSGRELISRLRASGLRVPAVERPVRKDLLRRWAALFPDAPAVGEDLVARWAQPGRHYHGLHHLRAVLDHLGTLRAAGEPVGRSVLLAAWFHDAVHDGESPADEEASARLATELLEPVAGSARAGEVARLVRLTATHDPEPDDHAGQVLCDADLAVLGGGPAAYLSYTEQVRAEYGHVPGADFRAGRAAVLQALLDRPALFRTTTGRRLWESPARRNMAGELARLQRSRP